MAKTSTTARRGEALGDGAVMERLGMADSGRFEHPSLPVGSSLREHVLDRLRQPP